MEQTLTIQQAFAVMTRFLTLYWQRTGSEDVANLLSDMSTDIWTDGSTADPAMWNDWQKAVNVAVKNSDQLTALQAYSAMAVFLNNYIPFKIPSLEVATLLEGVQCREPFFWETWLRLVQRSLCKKK